MAGAINTLMFNGSRRIRCFCTQSLGAGAFSSISYYTVTNLDGLGASPTVKAVFSIANTPGAFELAISFDLVAGALYELSVVSLPFADTSTFTGSIEAEVPVAANTPDPQAEPSTGDFSLYYYGRDILLSDTGDFALSPTGDLATIYGRVNWEDAILRRVISDGIPWDASYGALPSTFVNAPTQYQLPLSAKLVQQARADNRTLNAQVALIPNPGATPSNPSGLTGQFAFQLTVQGRDGLTPATVTVPAPSGPTS